MERVIFRRAIFGGLQKADVYAYIESLEEEKEKLKLSMGDEIQKLQKEIDELKEKNYHYGSRFSVGSDSLEIQQLKESLAQAEKVKLEYKHQLYKSDIQRAELLKKLEETQGGGVGASLRFVKIQNEARQIAVQQKKEAEEALARVRASVEMLMQQNKNRIAELEMLLAEKSAMLEEVNSKYVIVSAKLEEKEAALEEMRGSAYSGKQELEYANKKLEEKEAELSAIKQELSEQRNLVKMAEEVLDTRNTYNLVLDIPSENVVEKRTVEDSILVSAAEKTSDLDDIFAMANVSLNNSEEEAQQKIIQLNKIVG